MAKISLQFHAQRKEISKLVVTWVNEFQLWLAYETLVPRYSCSLVAEGRIAGELEIPSSVNRLVLSLSPLNMEPAMPFGLVGNNPSVLSILLGLETEDRLGESVLQAMTDDAKSLGHWRKISRGLAATLHKGARVVNPTTGASSRVDDHYYSSTAKDLCHRGVRMVGPSELLSYEFD